MALGTITSPSSPIADTDVNKFLTNVYQLTSNNINTSQRKALMAWFLVNWLKGLSGTDYRSALGTLESDTKSYLSGFQPRRSMGDDYEAAVAAAYYNAALNGGNPTSHTAINDLLADTSVLAARTQDDLDQIILFLLIKISIAS